MFDNMKKSSAIVSVLLILFIYQVRGQACPQGINAAHMCVPGIYTSDRVFIDTTTFNTFLNNCTCSFTTTSNVLKLLTYMAPNYPQCNSAIRIQTESGNNMRFECLGSGTYIDTSIHKSGQATFEKYSEYYDNNYCLMLEVAGQPTDTITVTCTADIPLEYLENSTVQTSSNSDYAFNDVTSTTSAEVFPINDVTTDATGYVAELTTLQPTNQSNMTFDNITEPVMPSPEAPLTNTTENDIYFTSTETAVEITTESKATQETLTESQLQTTEQAAQVQTNGTTMTVDPINTTMAAYESSVADVVTGQTTTTSAISERQTSAQPITISTTSGTGHTALNDVTNGSQTTVNPQVEVNNTTEHQTSINNMMVDPKLDKHQDMYVSMDTMNLTKVNTSSNVENYISDTAPSRTEEFVDTSSNSSGNADNYTISFDNMISSPVLNNEVNITDNFTTATDMISVNTNVSETIDVTGDTNTNGTNIVTAIVTGTVLFNSSGNNSPKTIQTIDTVPQEILTDGLNRKDLQPRQTTAKYDISFMSNLSDNLSSNKAIEFSSPSPLFDGNMETAPITPPTDISNSLIMIPKYAEAIENSTGHSNNTANQTTDYDLNFPGMNTLTESETANIAFTNNVLLETSPFTANEPRVVTENSEPIIPIENITNGVFENVQTNTEAFSFDTQNDQQNSSTVDPLIDANSTGILNNASLLSDSNSANSFTMDTLSGDSIFITDRTPVNENGATTTENVQLLSTTVSTTESTKNYQDLMPSETISSFDMHNNLHDTVITTFSKQPEATDGGYKEVTTITTTTDSYIPTSEGINEPFVNVVSSEFTNSMNNVPSSRPEAIHTPEYMNSNLSDSFMEQNVTGLDVAGNSTETMTADEVSVVEPSKSINITDYMKHYVSDSSVEQNKTIFDAIRNPAENMSADGANSADQSTNVSEYWTDSLTGNDTFVNQMENATNTGSMTIDQLSVVEPTNEIHTFNYLNNNVLDSNMEQNNTTSDVLGNPAETITTGGAKNTDQISIVEPSESIHLSEYWDTNMSDSKLDQHLTDIGVPGIPTENITTDGTVTADQISIVEPSKRIHVSEYLNNNVSDSSTEHNSTGVDVQENQFESSVYHTPMIADQISIVEPSKRIHISEYLTNNALDSNLEQNVTGIDVHGDLHDNAMTADQISIVDPSNSIHIPEYFNNNVLDSNLEQNVTGVDAHGDQMETLANAESSVADKISIVEPSKSIHVSEYPNNNLSDSNIENTTAGDWRGDTVLVESTTWSPASTIHDAGAVPTGTVDMLPETSTFDTKASSSVAANIDETTISFTNKVLSTESGISSTESELTKETSTFNTYSNVPPMPNIISEEIVPEQSIPNESVLPTVNTNYIDNIDNVHASKAAEVLANIENLALNESGSVIYNESSTHATDTATMADNESYSNMMKSAVDILSEIEKQVITDNMTSPPVVDDKVALEQTTNDVVPPLELESTSASETGTNTISSTTPSNPVVPTSDLLEPNEFKNADEPAKEIPSPKPSTLPEIIAATDSAFGKVRTTPNAFDKVPTTPRRSFNIVEDTMVVTESPRAVEIGANKVNDKEMNVSFDKESKGLAIDTNNNTYIIVVGIIAGLVVLATVIGIVCHNKRKRRSEKVNISGTGIDPASHQNRAYDSETNDPEQGTSVVENDPESSLSNGEQNGMSSKAQEY